MDTLKLNTELNCEYSEAIYQKAMSKRYGIKFCCDNNLEELELELEKLILGEMGDCEYTIVESK